MCVHGEEREELLCNGLLTLRPQTENMLHIAFSSAELHECIYWRIYWRLSSLFLLNLLKEPDFRVSFPFCSLLPYFFLEHLLKSASCMSFFLLRGLFSSSLCILAPFTRGLSHTHGRGHWFPTLSSTLPACLKSRPPRRPDRAGTMPRSILTHRVLRFTDEVAAR